MYIEQGIYSFWIEEVFSFDGKIVAGSNHQRFQSRMTGGYQLAKQTLDTTT